MWLRIKAGSEAAGLFELCDGDGSRIVATGRLEIDFIPPEPNQEQRVGVTFVGRVADEFAQSGGLSLQPGTTLAEAPRS